MATNQAQKKSEGQDRDYFDIRNARSVKKADNDNHPREASFVPERRTEPPDADNDNNKDAVLRKVAVEYSKSYRRGKSSFSAKTVQMPTRTIPANINTLKKASFVPVVITAGGVQYKFQIIFGIIALVGFFSMGVIDSSSVLSVVNTVTFGFNNASAQALWLIGTVGALISGGFIAFATAKPLSMAGGHPASGGSILVLAVCFTLHLAPIVNIFPIMAIWCAFVLFAK